MIGTRRVEIRTKGGMTIWELIKSFINGLEAEEEFRRKDAIRHVYTEDISHTITSADNYLYDLVTFGFVEKVKLGTYKKKFDVPADLKLSVVRKAKADKSWAAWFKPVHEQLNINENECPPQRKG